MQGKIGDTKKCLNVIQNSHNNHISGNNNVINIVNIYSFQNIFNTLKMLLKYLDDGNIEKAKKLILKTL